MHNVNATRKRPPAGDDDTPKPKRGRPRQYQILTRYPPLKDTNDDDITISRKVSALSAELEKHTPRKEVVLSLSQQVYGIRRDSILVEAADSVTAILETHKELHKTYVVK